MSRNELAEICVGEMALEINKIICGDKMEVMPTFPDNCIGRGN